MLSQDYSVAGTFEAARVTGFPMQQAARVSPGSGISAMQVTTALRKGALVPWNKQQVERPKTALDLLHSDKGGLVYQPLPGCISMWARSTSSPCIPASWCAAISRPRPARTTRRANRSTNPG